MRPTSLNKYVPKTVCRPVAKKKAGGKKKKGLALTPEQTVNLTNITGCLKFLSLVSLLSPAPACCCPCCGLRQCPQDVHMHMWM